MRTANHTDQTTSRNDIAELLLAGETKRARSLIQDAAKVVEKNSPVVFLLLAKTYKVEGRTKMALRFSEKAWHADPKNRLAATLTSECLLILRRLPEALIASHRACKLDKNGFEARMILAQILATTDEPRAALKIVRNILKLHPKALGPLCLGALLAHRLRRHHDALAYFLTLKKLHHREDDPLFYELAGDSALELFALNHAKYFYTIALDKDPQSKRTIWGLAVTLSLLGTIRKPIALRQRFIDCGKLSTQETAALAELDELIASNKELLAETKRQEKLHWFLKATVEQLETMDELRNRHLTTLKEILSRIKQLKPRNWPGIKHKYIDGYLTNPHEDPQSFFLRIHQIVEKWDTGIPLKTLIEESRATLNLGKTIAAKMQELLTGLQTDYRKFISHPGH